MSTTSFDFSSYGWYARKGDNDVIYDPHHKEERYAIGSMSNQHTLLFERKYFVAIW